jgi:molybdopterin converting factor small subunit
MADVHLPRSLVALFPGAPRRLEIEAGSISEVVDRLDEQWPGLRDRLLEPGPRLREHINVFVDGEPASLDTGLRPGATVHIIPAIAGG